MPEEVKPEALDAYMQDLTGRKDPAPVEAPAKEEPKSDVPNEPEKQPEKQPEATQAEKSWYADVFGEKYKSEADAVNGAKELVKTLGDLDGLKNAKRIVESLESRLGNKTSFADGIFELSEQFGFNREQVLELLSGQKPAAKVETKIAEIADDDFLSGADAKKLINSVVAQMEQSAVEKAKREVLSTIQPIIGPQMEAQRVAELKKSGLDYVDNPDVLKDMKAMDRAHQSQRMDSDKILYYAVLGQRLAEGKIVELLGDKLSAMVTKKSVETKEKAPDVKEGAGGGSPKSSEKSTPADSYMTAFREMRV